MEDEILNDTPVDNGGEQIDAPEQVEAGPADTPVADDADSLIDNDEDLRDLLREYGIDPESPQDTADTEPAEVAPEAASDSDLDAVLEEIRRSQEQAPASTDPAEVEQDPSQDFAEPQSISTEWQALRREIEAGWELDKASGYEPPKSERSLVAMIDKMASRFEEIEHRVAVADQWSEHVQAQQIQTESAALVNAAATAAKTLSEKYGLSVTVKDVMAAAENGGIQAFGALNRIQDIQLLRPLITRPDVLVESFELANRGRLRAAPPNTERNPPRKQLPSVLRGNGTGGPRPELSADDEIRADLRAHSRS